MSTHDMPEDVAAALKVQGPLCLDGPHAPAGPLAAVEMVTLALAGVHALGRGHDRPPSAMRAADRDGISNRLPSKWQKKLLKTAVWPFRLPEMCLFHEAGFFENADSAGSADASMP
ncbi:hypothetical protein EN751_28435 [Mesorhizobium sp. M4A.F.Ca.ET.029.04.2.1]|nr:hypothetical protein EN751_28435 [Mesorhizobium sp. M4A.F.Ca.ET.029.04.2.1]